MCTHQSRLPRIPSSSASSKGVEFCYLNRPSCFDELNGLAGLEATLKSCLESAPEGSYIEGLFNGPNLLRSKIMEETDTLCSAGMAEEGTFYSRARSLSNIEHVTYPERPRHVLGSPRLTSLTPSSRLAPNSSLSTVVAVRSTFFPRKSGPPRC